MAYRAHSTVYRGLNSSSIVLAEISLVDGRCGSLDRADSAPGKLFRVVTQQAALLRAALLAARNAAVKTAIALTGSVCLRPEGAVVVRAPLSYEQRLPFRSRTAASTASSGRLSLVLLRSR